MQRVHRALCGSVVFALIFCCSFTIANAGLTEDEQKLVSAINLSRITATINRLCSQEFQGRRAGSIENKAIVDYLTSRFVCAGLSPLPEVDSYVQPLTIRYSLVRSKDEIEAVLKYNTSSGSGIIKRIRKFPYRNYNGVGGIKLKSKVVFVGYGIDDPWSGYSDYSDLDVNGKIVLWISGKPPATPNVSAATLAHKMAAAYQRGAIACLIFNASGSKEELGVNIGLAGQIADFPCIVISKTVANELLAPAGLNVEQLASLNYKNLPRGVEGADVEIQITPICDPSRRTYNVLGILPGSDPSVADEVIIIGAHYDHIGVDANGRIYPGADDNASGTSILLEVAEVFKKTMLKPRRSIVFVAWTGEEAGLVGSNYFVENPPFPLEKVRMNINLDMVGTGLADTFVVGSSSEPIILKESASDLGMTLLCNKYVGASDHLAFARKKIPSFLIYASGEHPNFHTTHDVPASLNLNVLENAARLAVIAVWRAANEQSS